MITGPSRAQVTRLIARFQATGTVWSRSYRRHRFPQCCGETDVALPARVDEAHETLCGPATRRILEREYLQYGQPEFARLASISVAHLYNLRRQPRYRQRRLAYTPTRPTAVVIGERRRPDPQGRPGFLQVDTVHQGDAPGRKGVCHINAVDEVAQWQILIAVAEIDEACLQPALADLLIQFPFRILSFHSDNGSEFIHQTVAALSRSSSLTHSSKIDFRYEGACFTRSCDNRFARLLRCVCSMNLSILSSGTSPNFTSRGRWI